MPSNSASRWTSAGNQTTGSAYIWNRRPRYWIACFRSNHSLLSTYGGDAGRYASESGDPSTSQVRATESYFAAASLTGPCPITQTVSPGFAPAGAVTVLDGFACASHAQPASTSIEITFPITAVALYILHPHEMNSPVPR